MEIIDAKNFNSAPKFPQNKRSLAPNSVFLKEATRQAKI